MNFFRQLLGKGHKHAPKAVWATIIDEIHDIIREERPTFYAACVRILNGLGYTGIGSALPDEKADLMIAVLQLNVAQALASEREYISADDMESFSDALFQKLRGSTASAAHIAHLRDRYWSGEQYMDNFFRDLLQNISIKEPLKESEELVRGVLLESTFLRFTDVVRAATAKAFGDQRLFEEIKMWPPV